ncbi:MAG: DNA repair protein RecO C-terminal domain-containing protein [Planctomycetes bacterium]|nr:DNA repair protein RecO C-terminal domain-containing protein [Planctomycetota bacterium]
MKGETSPAIVLRRWPFSESSLALRVLTPGHGVVALLAKGAYKPTSGWMGVLDTWALVELEFGGPEEAELKNLYRARLLDRLTGLSAEPDRLAAAALAAELAELAAPPGPEAAAAFHYLLQALHELAGGAEVGAQLLRSVLGGLDLLGLGPVLADPAGGAGAGDGSSRWFSAADGGLMPSGAARPEQTSRRISPAQVELLRSVRAGLPGAAEAADSVDREACLTILGDFLHYHLERPPRAWDFLRRRRHPTPNR